MGGGLAGLTLALQLRQRLPALDIVVLERLRHPVPEAAHKVGESSVEIGAHYFDTVLGLKEHLDAAAAQEVRFPVLLFGGELRRSTQVVELGASRYLATPSYQLDRGIFENFLAQHAQCGMGDDASSDGADGDASRAGGRADSGALRELRRTKSRTTATGASSGQARAGSSMRRVAPGSSSASSISRKRTSTTPTPSGSASARASTSTSGRPIRNGSRAATRRIAGSPPITCAAKATGRGSFRCPRARIRWASSRMRSCIRCKTMNSFERAMEWFREHQPRLARALEDKRHLLQDFVALRRFSYGCKRVFSGTRWALTGEAGVFLDPFYSPGSDFIAISNTYITELVAKDRARRADRAVRAPLRAVLLFVLPQHAHALHGPVRDVRRSGSDAGEGDLGLHVLLGRAVPALLPAPPHGPHDDGAAARGAHARHGAERRPCRVFMREWSQRQREAQRAP